MNTWLLRTIAAQVIVLTATAASGQQVVVYTNFGPGGSFDTNVFHGWTINGYIAPGVGQQAVSHRFTPTATATFTSAQIALNLWAGQGVVTVYLQEDALGLPGPVIEQITIGGLTYPPAVYTAQSTLFPQLQGGMAYWFTVVAGTGGVLAAWQWNAIGDMNSGDNFAGTQDGSPSGPWGLDPWPTSTRGAFQINGTIVPITVVGIDIKPGSFPNAINPRSAGRIPVAIITDGAFDATTVDPASVRFGRTGEEAASMGFALADVDGDGDLDMMLHFEGGGIVCGDTEALLSGRAFGGSAFRGADAVMTVGCK